jgi:hypothetical protein
MGSATGRRRACVQPNVGALQDNAGMSFDVSTWGEATASGAPMPSARVTVRVMGEAVEESLMSFTRVKLEEILPDDLQLPPPADPLEDYPTKRTLIGAFISGRSLPGLAELAERIIETLGPDPTLEGLVTRYRDGGGGVAGPVKNLIFAADGPKPELVLRDAINNQIEIVANAEHCVVYDRPVAADGPRSQHSSPGGASGRARWRPR